MRLASASAFAASRSLRLAASAASLSICAVTRAFSFARLVALSLFDLHLEGL